MSVGNILEDHPELIDSKTEVLEVVSTLNVSLRAKMVN